LCCAGDTPAQETSRQIEITNTRTCMEFLQIGCCGFDLRRSLKEEGGRAARTGLREVFVCCEARSVGFEPQSDQCRRMLARDSRDVCAFTFLLTSGANGTSTAVRMTGFANGS